MPATGVVALLAITLDGYIEFDFEEFTAEVDTLDLTVIPGDDRFGDSALCGSAARAVASRRVDA